MKNDSENELNVHQRESCTRARLISTIIIVIARYLLYIIIYIENRDHQLSKKYVVTEINKCIYEIDANFLSNLKYVFKHKRKQEKLFEMFSDQFMNNFIAIERLFTFSW